MARLVLLSEGLTGKTFELKPELTTVGRLPDNALQIPEGSVSSHHAEIEMRGNELFVRDLDSTNGTFINGEKIKEGVVKPGQILRLGMVDMRLETGDAQSAAARQKKLDQTRVIPKGVKLDDLVGTQPLDVSKTGFERKDNKATKWFIVFAIVAGAILVGLLVYVVWIRPTTGAQ
ncbi:MAG TPA: FHA domain-containing protein [Verrucomicrobiae bacterium]|nr:FHA domain-containing protein [Verrucomicrobiae bacterium]